jgi:hypothetical protein
MTPARTQSTPRPLRVTGDFSRARSGEPTAPSSHNHHRHLTKATPFGFRPRTNAARAKGTKAIALRKSADTSDDASSGQVGSRCAAFQMPLSFAAEVPPDPCMLDWMAAVWRFGSG